MGKKNDDRTYLVIGSSDIGAFGRLLIAGVLAFFAAIGVETRNRVTDTKRDEIAVLTQGQEDIRQMVLHTQGRSLQCENRIGSIESDVAHLWRKVEESQRGRYSKTAASSGK